jgi:L-ascorbate metabolism protein UlaG (beta-lactamase superfamily)
MPLHFRWLGNAGFEFKLGSTTLLVDPFLTRPKQSRVYFGRVAPDSQAVQAHIPSCDHILVSHTHFDHFMDVPGIAMRTGAVIHGSANTCDLARILGVPEDQTHQIMAGDEFVINGIQVRVITAAHPWIPGYMRGDLRAGLKPPLRLRDYRMDACLSFLISYRGSRILVWSSTGIEHAPAADVLICRAVSGGKWYAQIMASVQPHLVIPSHWDDMFRPLTEPPQAFFSPPRLAFPPIRRIDMREFDRKIKEARPGCEVLVPQRFKEYRINSHPEPVEGCHRVP